MTAKFVIETVQVLRHVYYVECPSEHFGDVDEVLAGHVGHWGQLLEAYATFTSPESTLSVTAVDTADFTGPPPGFSVNGPTYVWDSETEQLGQAVRWDLCAK